jgi:phosphoglycolate phosphatase
MRLFNIEQYLDDVIGISNIYAESKVSVGREYITRSGIDTGKTVLIGDTVHDYEVAQALGVDCILIANGHQSKHRLLECGGPVLDDIINVTITVRGRG